MNGPQHKFANICTGIFLTATTYLIFQREDLTLAAAIGSAVGTTVTPDFDLDKDLPRSIFSKIPVVAVFWGLMWWPYQKLVKHRSWVSHSPLVSTVIRLLYMLFWFCLIVLVGNLIGLFYVNLGAVFWFVADNFEFFATLFFCWVVQDLVHLWLDFVV